MGPSGLWGAGRQGPYVLWIGHVPEVHVDSTSGQEHGFNVGFWLGSAGKIHAARRLSTGVFAVSSRMKHFAVTRVIKASVTCYTVLWYVWRLERRRLVQQMFDAVWLGASDGRAQRCILYLENYNLAKETICLDAPSETRSAANGTHLPAFNTLRILCQGA